MVTEITDVAPKLQAAAASFVKEQRLPGAAVGIVHGDELVWFGAVGFADVATGRLPDRRSLYRVASITKTFTGTAIMQLRDEGLLHLDDPAVRYLPELRAMASPFGPVETVTIRRMLSHESGLASEPPDTDWSEPAYQGGAAENLARAVEMGTKVPPNSQHKYSNLAYQLLGEIVARVAGRPYPDYVRAAILEPLGISTSGFDPLPEDWAARRATGYAGRSFSDVLDRAAQAPQIWAEGGLWSCVDDMAKWISLQLREDGGPRKDAQVLSGSSLHEMHRPRYLMGDDWTEAWGIAWYAIRRQEVVWIQHAGGLHGFSSNVCFDPRHKVGAIALLNGIGDAAELSMQLAGIARDALRAVAAPVARPPAMSAAFGPLLGVYMNHEFGQLLRLEWRDGKLAVIDPDDATWRPTLTPTDDPNVFVVDPGCRESGEPAVFHRVSDGRVRSVLLATTTWVRLDPVTSDQ